MARRRAAQPTFERMFYRGERTRPAAVMGTSERFVDVNFADLYAGRIFSAQEVLRRRPLAVIGYGPYPGSASRRGASTRSTSGCGSARTSSPSSVWWTSGPPPALQPWRDDFVIIPYTVFRKQFGNERVPARTVRRHAIRDRCGPRESVTREEAMQEVEAIIASDTA
ncbi:MAG: ABC transporter permease [Vicinamibacterales bacterium]